MTLRPMASLKSVRFPGGVAFVGSEHVPVQNASQAHAFGGAPDAAATLT